MLWTVLGVWVIGLLYSFKKINERIILFAFYLTFFNFLLGRLASELISTALIDEQTNEFTFAESTRIMMYTNLFLSLVSVNISYIIFEHKIKGKLTINPNSFKTKKIREISKILVYCTIVFLFLKAMDATIFVLRHGYMAYYLNFQKSMPEIVYWGADVFDIVFYIFLATLPAKKECKPIFIIYLSITAIYLVMGQRNGFMIPFLFIVIYLFLRNNIDGPNTWIGHRGKLILALGIPFLLGLMYAIIFIRNDSKIRNTNSLYLFANYFYQQGGSVEIIGLADQIDGHTPPGQMYSLGNVIRRWQSSLPMRIMGLYKSYKSQSPEMAQHGHSLGSYLTNKYQPNRYRNGGNMATCYIAEVWLDFGFIGVIICNLIYGFILSRIMSWCRKNVWITAISFVMMMCILYAPRAGASAFIADIMSPTYLLVAFGIYLYSLNRGNTQKISVRD